MTSSLRPLPAAGQDLPFSCDAARPDMATIAVYVLVRDSNGAPEMLVGDVVLSQLDLDNGEHYGVALSRAHRLGFDALNAFDENDPAARAVTRSACIEMAAQEQNERSEPAPSA